MVVPWVEIGFWDSAAARPEAPAMISAEGEIVSAGELLDEAHRATRGLRELGMACGDTLAVALPPGPEMLGAVLGALQGGWYVAVLDPQQSSSEMEHRVRACRADLLLGSDLKGACRSLSRAGWRDCVLAQPASEPEDRRPGRVVAFTSGTTGRARVVRQALSQKPLATLGKLAYVHLNAVCGIRPGRGLVHLVSSSLHHSASLLWCLDQLHLGHCVALGIGLKPEPCLAFMERHRVTSALVVPTWLYRVLQLPVEVRRRYDLSALQHLVHTGAPCSKSLKQRALDWLGPVLYEVYGSAEVAGTRVTPQEWLRRPGTVGRSYGRVRVVDRSGAECAPLETGRITLRAPRGRDGYITTGDLGYLDEEGYLFLRGREDDVILSGGVNVYPHEVEEVLREHPAVDDVAVIGVQHPEWGQSVEALVVVSSDREEGPTLSQELLGVCRQTLRGAAVPKVIHYRADLGRDAVGKLSRSRLARAFSSDDAAPTRPGEEGP